MQAVTFTGYYGMQNYGDDLFGVVCAHGARTWWSIPAPRILAPAIPGETGEFRVPRVIPSRLYARADPAGTAVRALFALREMLGRGWLVFGGGSLFSSNRSPVHELLAPLSRISGKRFAAIGVSIGPFNSRASEKAVIEFLRRFEYISVRDQASFDILNGCSLDARIACGRDLAGLMPDIAGSRLESGKEVQGRGRCIGYASCHLGGKVQTTAHLDDLFVDAVRRLPDVTVRVFNLNSHPVLGDEHRSHQVRDRLAAAGIRVEMVDYSKVGVLATWNAIATCDAMVSIRLHGAISAYLSGVPFVLHEYHRKCTDFLDDVGQPATLRIGGIDPASLHGVDELAGRLRLLLTERCLPRLSRETYSLEATRHFTQAPWVEP